MAGRPKPYPDISIKLTLTNPFGGRPGLDFYPNIGDALVNQDTVSLLYHQHYTIGVFAILAMVAVKFWLVPIAIGDRMAAGDPERREIHRVAEVFLLILLAGWVLIRHDQHGITHQVWLTLANAPLILAAVLARGLAPDGKWWRGGLLATAAAILALGYNPWVGFGSATTPHLGGVTPAELVRMSDDEAATRKPGEPESDYCIRALLHGRRLLATEVTRDCVGTLGALAVEPETGRNTGAKR